MSSTSKNHPMSVALSHEARAALTRHRLHAEAQDELGLNISAICSKAILEACGAWDRRNASRGVSLADFNKANSAAVGMVVSTKTRHE